MADPEYVELHVFPGAHGDVLLREPLRARVERSSDGSVWLRGEHEEWGGLDGEGDTLEEAVDDLRAQVGWLWDTYGGANNDMGRMLRAMVVKEAVPE